MSKDLSVRAQCDLIGLNRSSLYYSPKEISLETLRIMNMVDEEYTRHPFYGSRRMAVYLRKNGKNVNRKQVQRIYRKLGLEAIYPKKNLSMPDKAHKIYPYLLRDVNIISVDQVWSTDITYVRMAKGFIYLMAIMDWFSRYILGWSISISLEGGFCVDKLQDVLLTGRCGIFNMDQGSQFTSPKFTGVLESYNIKVSMDGKGRCLDNIFIERLWRSVKYECVYPRNFASVSEAKNCLKEYFDYYNNERMHQSLRYKTPAEVYFKGRKI